MSFIHRFFLQPRAKQPMNEHTYKGSLVRHIAFENGIHIFSRMFSARVIRNDWAFRILRLPIVVAWGLNCNFPVGDIGRYLVYWLKVIRLEKSQYGRPLSIWEA